MTAATSTSDPQPSESQDKPPSSSEELVSDYIAPCHGPKHRRIFLGMPRSINVGLHCVCRIHTPAKTSTTYSELANHWSSPSEVLPQVVNVLKAFCFEHNVTQWLGVGTIVPLQYYSSALRLTELQFLRLCSFLLYSVIVLRIRRQTTSLCTTSEERAETIYRNANFAAE